MSSYPSHIRPIKTKDRVLKAALYIRPSATPASDASLQLQAAKLADYLASLDLQAIPVYHIDPPAPENQCRG